MRKALLLLLATLPLAARAADAAGRGPLTSLPYVPGLDPAAMDRGADPCVDFYAFACGGWLRANPLPADQARWSVFSRLAEDNARLLWGILAQAADPSRPRSADERKLGDHFASCMDEDAVERAGATPLRAELDAIARARTPADLARVLGRLEPLGGGGFLFDLSSEQDARDATRVIGVLAAGGLGLPDRDAYLAEDERARETRARYREHVARMLALAGDAPAEAAAGAEAVLRLETALARASLSPVDRRDPYRVYHRMTRSQLAALVPALPWNAYLAAAGAPRVSTLNVTEPAFMLEVQARLEQEPISAWRSYLRFHLADARAPQLSRAFQRAHFEFHEGFLNGVREEPPRWKRCVAWVDRDLGEALGRVYVARAVGADVKARVEEMWRRVADAMAARLRDNPWMTQPTRQAALAKLAAVRAKIGWPARWRDYRRLEVVRGDLAGNVERALRFESARLLARIGRPVDRDEWQMTPPTVNAYYEPRLNDVNFPAGVLQPPLFDGRLDLAPAYGDTGATIGHELTHAFDDEGRQFDGAGNLRDWWTDADAAEFQRRTACIADQYGQYPAVGEVRINARLTLGEDVADLGGLVVAWHAWRDATRGQELPTRDGLTPEQRFFVGYAQWACENASEASQRLAAATDPHSPARWRVNGVVANVPEFREAFACRAGQPMVRENACRVW